MKEDLTHHEARMRRALLRELSSLPSFMPNRVDVVMKHWVVARSKRTITILEGKLSRNVWSGDVTISFRKLLIPTKGE